MTEVKKYNLLNDSATKRKKILIPRFEDIAKKESKFELINILNWTPIHSRKLGTSIYEVSRYFNR